MKNKNYSPLSTFAFLGADKFIDKLEYLSKLAEPENWYYDYPNAKNEKQKKLGVLYQYIHHTFGRAQEEEKILITTGYAIMNTGLFSTNGEQIFALFTPNRYSIEGSQKWFLSSFYKESSHDIPPEARNHLPAYVDYFANCPDEMYFDPKLKLLTNFDHILEENFDRLPESIKAFPKDLILTLFNGATLFLQKKISRNNRLVVPQYYNKRIMYLAPLKIGKDIIPLAIEKNIDTYRVNTIFTRGMAYCNARLLMKPESNWLINEQE